MTKFVTIVEISLLYVWNFTNEWQSYFNDFKDCGALAVKIALNAQNRNLRGGGEEWGELGNKDYDTLKFLSYPKTSCWWCKCKFSSEKNYWWRSGGEGLFKRKKIACHGVNLKKMQLNTYIFLMAEVKCLHGDNLYQIV